MGKTGKVTAAQSQILQEVFATRGGVAVRLLIEHFDDLSDQIKDAIENAGGFAQKMRELRMDTIAGQMARMKNILAVLMDDFVTTAYGAENLADAIKLLNSSFEATRPIAKGMGQAINFLGAGFRENYYQVRAFIEAMQEIPTGGIPFIGGIPIQQLQRAAEIAKQYREEDIKRIKETQEAREEYLNNEEKIKTLREEQLKLTEEHFSLAKEGRLEEAKQIEESIKLIEKKIVDLQPAEIKLQKLLNKEKDLTNQIETEELGLLDKIEQKEKHRIRVMKNLGASALDIARAELQILENQTIVVNERKNELDLIKAKYKVTEEEVKYREQITDVLLKAEVDLAKAAGASESQVLEIIEDQLEARKNNISQDKYQLQLINLRIQQQTVLLAEKVKEVNVARSLAVSYEKADMFEKGRVRRAIELTRLTDEELTARYRNDVYDREVILQYWSSFRKSAQEAITEAIYQMQGLGEMPRLETKDLLPKDEIIEYWQSWTEKGINAGNTVNANFKTGMPTFGVPGGGVPPTAPVGAGAPTGLPSIVPTLPPTGLPTKLPEPVYASQSGVRELSGKLLSLITVTKEGNIILTDNLERVARQQELNTEELKTLEEAIRDGTLDQTTVQKQIRDYIGR